LKAVTSFKLYTDNVFFITSLAIGWRLAGDSLVFSRPVLCSSQISDILPSIFESSVVGSPLAGRSVELPLLIHPLIPSAPSSP
jgi:hypothetical protein